MRVPNPKMLMSKDVFTPFGVRQIQLLWGNVLGADERDDDVVNEDTPRQNHWQITGSA